MKLCLLILLILLYSCQSGDNTTAVSVQSSGEKYNINNRGHNIIIPTQSIQFQQFDIVQIDLSSDYQAQSIVSLPNWLNCDSAMFCNGVAIWGLSQIEYTNSEGQKLSLDIFVHGDPLADYSWFIHNTAQTSFSVSSALPGIDINMLNLIRNGYTGRDIRVLVSDTGADFSHEDLYQNLDLVSSYNYHDPSSLPLDNHGHGTAVAGIIAAMSSNNIGGRGIASEAQIVVRNFLTSFQTSEVLMDQASADVDVFNYSYSDFSHNYLASDEDYLQLLHWGATHLRDGKGAVYVKAAGNDYTNKIIGYAGQAHTILPHNANLPQDNESTDLIVVGAINANGVKASYSNAGSNLWVSAPGGEADFGAGHPAILTTDINGCDNGFSLFTEYAINAFEYGHALNPFCDYTSTMNGTSAATPIVSGIVALMLEANPDLSSRDVKYILAKTAKKIDSNFSSTMHPSSNLDLLGYEYESPWMQNSAGFWFHNWYGFGLVDATAAVEMAANYTNYLPEQIKHTQSFTPNLSIPDEDPNGVVFNFSMTPARTLEHIVLELDIEADSEPHYGYPGEVGVEIISAQGQKSILLNINNSQLTGSRSHYRKLRLLTNAFYGVPTSGNWQIRFIDGSQYLTGSVKRIIIESYYH